MYPKLNPGPPPPPPPPPPPLQSWVLRWVIAYQKHKNFPLSPLQAGATPPPCDVKTEGFNRSTAETVRVFALKIKACRSCEK